MCESDHPKKKKGKKNKQTIKKEEWKQIKNNLDLENIEKFGYSYLKNNSKLMKYWKKRHMLFSEFEKGIRLDEGISILPKI